MTPRRRYLTSTVAAATLALGMLTGGPLTLGAPAAAAAAAAPGEALAVAGLQTNARTTPLGIGADDVVFGWRSTGGARGVVQSAYELEVAEADGGAAVWSSGRVESSEQLNVAYAGPALASQTRYSWRVRVWDGAGAASEWSDPTWFETGLLDASDWGGAEWVGAPADTEVNRWTDYTADFDFTLDNLVFAAMIRSANTNNGYMWQVKAVGDQALFRPHTKVNGNYAALGDVDISSVITADELRTGQHRMSVTVDGDTITTSIDGEQIDTRTRTNFGKGYVGFRTSVATEGTEAFTVHAVRVEAENGDVLLDTDFSDGNPFRGGALVAGGLEVKGNQEFLWHSPDDNLPLLRTDFATDSGKSVERARIYATARGIYELTLNGEPVGDQHLAPGWTDYNTRFQHQTYDVTDQVRAGDNGLGATMGNGWWGGKVGMWGPGVYGNRLSLLARLRIDYTDGTTQWVDTGDDWTTHAGPYVAADNIDGETFDARLAQAGWDQHGYDDGGWTPAVVRESATELVVPQPDEPVRTTEEIDVVERTEPTPGAFVYDLGQNMVGVARMVLTGQAGTAVRVRYGEMLNPDGTLYTANLRAAKVTDYYTFGAAGTVTYEPTLTQHGFRYVEITGASTPPAAGDVTGVVWGSDLPAIGDLETSSTMLNQLQSNISWGQRGNFLSIPTDTPARDERLGWTGDINVFAPTASYLRDTRSFLAKWMRDLSDAAYANGNLPGIAPVPPGIDLGAGLGWSDAGITVPYAVFRALGDTAIVRQYYDLMTKYFDFVVAGAGPDLIDTARGNWNDWLNLNDDTPVGVLGTAYYAEDARMMAEMAAAIGEDADAAAFAQRSADVRAAFGEEYVAADGTVTGNSQTAYAMALGMDLVPEEMRDKVAAKFVAKLAASDNHLTTGFLGTPWLLPALTSIDRDDLAYELLLHEDYPSWGYEVAMGATTMWERWDSIKPDGSFGDVGMNSFNHYAYGAVGDWMYQHIGGISALEPGYRRFRVAPAVDGALTDARGELDSVYGTITTDWERQGDDLRLAVDVPVNTTAEVVLPAANVWAVTEGGELLADVEGVQGVTNADGDVVVTIGSGSYDFLVTAADAPLGAILDLIAAARDHVSDTVAGGDLTAEAGTHLTDGLDEARDAVLAARTADGEAATEHLVAALDAIRGLRAWLGDSEVDAPVRGAADTRLAAVEQALARVVMTAEGVTVSLPPAGAPVSAGAEATGTVDVANDGGSAVTDVAASVAVAGWTPVTVPVPDLAPGEDAQVPVTLAVPANAAAGDYDAALDVTFTLGGKAYEVSDVTADWVHVDSGLGIGEVTAEPADEDPVERVVLDVPVANDGDRDTRVSVAVRGLPAGWRAVPSTETLVPAGETVTATVPLSVPLDLVGGAVDLTVDVRQAGRVSVSKAASVTVDLPHPPTVEAVDHVDFGASASEQAHGLQASASSGTNTEAGYTRRYAHSAYPGSWYSVEVDVPAGEPFLIRNVETYDGPRTKKYNVYVDDVLVRTQLVPRTATGVGIKVYDLVVDDPAVLPADGTARIKYEYPLDASGYFDPSIADMWVLPLTDDTRAPDVSAGVTGGVPGTGGWYSSPVSVEVTAADGRDPAPVVQVGRSSGWQDYSGPVAIAEEGEHVVSYRATDAAGNRSAAGELTVGIDLTPPVTVVTAKRGSGVEGSDRAQVEFSAEDALSGVAGTRYRIDGGAWQRADGGPVQVEGYGDHVVEYVSTDLAGNTEAVHRTTVTLADVDQIAAVVAPQVTGVPQHGSTLTATDGSWNTKGLSFSRQWLRDGTPIAGATGTTYVVGVADLGSRLSVRVTATKAGDSGFADSATTGPVTAADLAVGVPVITGKARVGKKLAATLAVPAGATVSYQWLVGGKAIKKGTKATLRLKRKWQGEKVRVRVTVSLAGHQSVTVTSAAMKVRRR
ncbi:family 78 glycoside hydrolase catalytic domain [Nocardioides carbamazepini]|uniref:family 78 glycoside hydrolase catalytic domain n=1 Tax=Nocardioides carbamazepini TaxID=2854259 RepID=UPI002149EB56|nr:family 78 glycoside hydrolase catalytic domain [Nocardioides carbamazepini]MCR1784292.1 family 78 glycoside hydrolase catalytic domain [Nocardioides carbamazepini]